MMESSWIDVECNICKSRDYKILYKSNYDSELIDRHFSQYSVYADIVRCNKCGLIYESPREQIDIINQRLKIESYPIKESAIQERMQFFKLHIKSMKKIFPLKGKLLDIGCNIGDFMYLMQKEGLEVHGIEPSFTAAEKASKAFGLKVVNDVVDNAIDAFLDNSFDIITMWDVIEHLTNPYNILYKLNKKLKKDGYICIATHDIESLFARITKLYYPHLMYQHFYHFSQKTLSTILNNTGFDVVIREVFNKRWSLKYLFLLLKEFSPKNRLVCQVSNVLTKIIVFLHMQNIIVTIPIYNDMRVYARKHKN